MLRRGGDERIASLKETQWPVGRTRDADPWGDRHARRLDHGPAHDAHGAPLQGTAVVRSGDAVRRAQLSRTVGEIAIATCRCASRSQYAQIADRLHPTQQHRRSDAVGQRDGVQAPVHPVDAIHVCHARRPVQVLGPAGAPHHRMTGGIVRAQVGLRLDDARAMHAAIRIVHLQQHAEQFACDECGIAIVEARRERGRHGGRMRA